MMQIISSTALKTQEFALKLETTNEGFESFNYASFSDTFEKDLFEVFSIKSYHFD
jgi:hypothetical protein